MLRGFEGHNVATAEALRALGVSVPGFAGRHLGEAIGQGVPRA